MMASVQLFRKDINGPSALIVYDGEQDVTDWAETQHGWPWDWVDVRVYTNALDARFADPIESYELDISHL